MRSRQLTLSLGLAAIAALAAVPALANDGLPPEIFSLVQEGQDVVVTFGIVEPGGEPGIDQAFNLTRSGPEGNVLVFENETFAAADGVARDPWCWTQDYDGPVDPEDYCLASPEECTDCDGDAVNECPLDAGGFSSFCAAYLTYEVVDTCVPAGATGYVLATPDNTSAYMAGAGSIDVVASGEECGADESCSVAAVGGGGATPALLALLMGLVGLVALRRRRNG